MQEFTIESRSETFRIKDIQPTLLLALRTTIDFDDLEATNKLYNFILENLEVNIKGSWFNVKEKNREIYVPDEIKTDFKALNELINYFLGDYLKPLFTKSNK